jgi:hypothetical protein
MADCGHSVVVVVVSRSIMGGGPFMSGLGPRPKTRRDRFRQEDGRR